MTTIEQVIETGVDEKQIENYLRYLDNLRESGATNMFGARPWLMRAYPDLDEGQAAKVLTYWMATFSERHPNQTSTLPRWRQCRRC